MKLKKYLIPGLVIVILLLALFLRVYNLGRNASFSTDEVTTITNSMQPLTEIPRLESRTPLQALWVRLGAQILALGYGELNIYLLSVFVGVLAVAVVYFLGKLLFDNSVGLLVSLTMAVSAYAIYWSRSARYYSLMLLLSSAAFLCLYWALVTNRRRAWLLYVLFRTLSLYDHLTAVWVLVGEGIFALGYVSLPYIRKLRKGEYDLRFWQKSGYLTRQSLTKITSSRFFWFVISYALILLAYTPVWLSMLQDIFLGSSVLRIVALNGGEIAPREIRTGQLQSLLGGGWKGPWLVFEQLTAWITPLHVILFILFILGALFCVRKRQWTALLFILTIITTPLVLSKLIKSYSLVLDGRYLISFLPLYYTMVARGIIGLGHSIADLTRWRDNLARNAPLVTALIFAVVIAGLNMTKVPLTFRNTGQNWRSVSRFLEEHSSPDELILVNGTPTLAKALQYYLPERNVVERAPSQSLESYFTDSDTFWLVFQPGTSMYNGLRYWMDDQRAVSLIFPSGWYPDIDQNSDLAPAQNWDLYAGQVSREKMTAEQALQLHNTWLAEAEADSQGDVRRHLTLAEANKRVNNCADAINEYNRALFEGYVNDQLASYIYYARGTCWNRLGKPELAISDWQKAISSANWSKEPYEQLFALYNQLGRIEEAQALYQSAQVANPKKAWPLVMQGDFYRMGGLAEQAISTYIQGIELEPTEPTTYQHMSEIYMAAGEFSRVVSVYKDAAQRNPKFGWPHFQLGQFYNSMGKISEAIIEYHIAIGLQPELAPAVSDFLLQTHWDLGSNLDLVHAYSDQGDLLWRLDNTWTRPYPYEPDVLVGHSTLTVEGKLRPNQLLLHPFDDEENTYIEFTIPQNYFSELHVGYGLADQAMPHSNGVHYVIEARRSGEAAYQPLLDVQVEDNVWQEQTFSLLPYRGDDLQFRLVVNAIDDYTYDWLQTIVKLVPPPQPDWGLVNKLRDEQSSPAGNPVE